MGGGKSQEGVLISVGTVSLRFQRPSAVYQLNQTLTEFRPKSREQ